MVEQEREKRSCLAKVWYIWIGICTSINSFFERFFSKWAWICGTYPYIVIGTSLLIALGFMAGFTKFKQQGHTERLYFPTNSHSKRHMDRSDKSFSVKAKPEEFILLTSNGSSIFTPEAFTLALELHIGLLKVAGDFHNICIKVNNKTGNDKCLYIGALEIFHYNESLMTDYNINSNDSLILKALNDNTTLYKNNRPGSINFRNYFGNFNYDKIKNKVSADSVRMLYYTVFAETDEVYDRILPIEKKMIDYFESRVAYLKAKGYTLEFLLGRSIDDSISESSGGDIGLVTVSITLMCVFTTIVLSRFKDLVAGHFAVGMIGISCIAFGIGGGFGIVLAGGEYFVAFVGVLPFLVLGVGIDDMFIIMGELDSIDPDIRGIPRLQKALGNVGASITMTTLTDLVAFAVSASTDFPAIRYFCIFASVSIFLAYFMVMTLLVAYISIDIKRIESGRLDIVPCIRKANYEPWKNSAVTVSNKVMEQYGKILMLNPVRVIVVCLSAGLLAAGIYGLNQVEEVFELKQLGKDGSYFITFLDTRANNYPMGSSINIIQDDPTYDYTLLQNQKDYSNLDQISLTSSYLQPRTVNWMSAFHRWSNQTYYTGSDFYTNLHEFLRENPMHYSDLIFKEAKIAASKVQIWEQNIDNWVFSKNSMFQLRDDLIEKTNITNLYASALRYFYNEQVAIVRQDTIRNLLICALAILVITAPYLVHPMVILLVFGGFVALVVELFGLMAAWNVPLNTISMITSIMAIGFAVDYSAHIAHAYMLSNEPTPELRAVDALKNIGASVLMGGITTFLGILVTAFGQSEIFRIFFKMVFGIVVLGLLNGLLFLPVLLSLLCRTNLKIVQEKKTEEIKREMKMAEKDGKVTENEVNHNNINKNITVDNNYHKQDSIQDSKQDPEQDTSRVDTCNNIVIENPHSQIVRVKSENGKPDANRNVGKPDANWNVDIHDNKPGNRVD